MFRTLVALSAAALLLPQTARAADTPGTPLRLIGEAPALDAGGLGRFVIDARVTRDEGETHSEVHGWFATLPPPSQSVEVSGSCVGKSCELSIALDSHKLKLSGEMIDLARPASGQFETADNDPAMPLAPKGAATLTPFADAVPGLGELAKPDAVDSRMLDDLLLWAGTNPAFGDDDAHPIDDFQRDHLAGWQRDNNRPETGLLFVADLDLLTAQRAAVQKTAGWVRLGGADQGWSAGYPAALLPLATREGAEHRFVSADGKASLVIAIDPPLSDADFDALVDKVRALGGGEDSHRSFTRSQGDLETSFVEAGKSVSQVYYNREGGLARLIYTYPDGDNPYANMDSIVTRSLRATDALKPGS